MSLSIEPERAWTVYLVHHAHTDIGYTDTQQKITRYHIDFIDDVLTYYRQWKSGDEVLEDFVWTLECFWSVEQWLACRDVDAQGVLVDAIRDRFVGLSTTYLHYNELIDYPLMRNVLQKCRAFASSNDLLADTALSADINGFSWGYAQALYDSGTRSLLNFLHSHHGFAPIGQKQTPFWWKTPQGDRLLVWNGEHYMLGNALGLVPGAGVTYVFNDELKPTAHNPETLATAEIRLPRYIKQLENDGYPQDFVVAGVGGTMSDNAPPHVGIAHWVRRWNSLYGERIRLEMTTPSAFMQTVANRWKDIPEYAGDWPDWWSDGLSSLPDETRMCREAQRGLERLKAGEQTLNVELDADSSEAAAAKISLYCEHTFSHSDSMKSPWDGTTKHIAAGKKAIAAEALFQVRNAEDQFKSKLGECPMRPGRPFTYKIINPYPHELSQLVPLYLESCDFHVRELAPCFTNVDSGKPLSAQKEEAPRGWNFMLPVTLDAGQSIKIRLDEGIPTASYKGNIPNDAIMEGLAKVDAVPCDGIETNDLFFETAHARISIHPDEGIVDWIDPNSGISLIAVGADRLPFTPVYEVTPVEDSNDSAQQVLVRTRMGRNRKGEGVERHVGMLTAVKRLESGPHYTGFRMNYELEGARMAYVEVRLHHTKPEADVVFRIHKESVWNPENVYLALPFAYGSESTLVLDKAGALVRPVADQLPGTLTDWYCLQSGYAVCSEDGGVSIATLDAPLLQLGPLEHGIRQLANGSIPERKPASAYSWLMTNYWETNFEASLGGFHEFRYRLRWGSDLSDSPEAVSACRKLAHKMLVFRSE